MAVWKNWAGNLSCDTEIYKPPDLAALIAKVSEAAAAGKRIRATGGSYSWAPLVPCPELIIDMDALNKIEFDSARNVFKVECGATIEELNRAAEDEGMTLITPTMFPKPSVGGVIAVGGHGTGFNAGVFSDQIVKMTIVTAGGKVEINDQHQDFEAAKVALGSFGIVFSIEVEVEPQYNVYVDKRLVPVSYVLEEFDDLQQSYEFLEMFWFPLQDKMWLYLMNRTTSPADAKTWWTRLKTRINTWIQLVAGNWVVPWIARNAPQATPIVNRFASKLANEVEEEVQTASDAFHFQKAYPLNWDLSYAVPADQAKLAWSKAIELVHEYARANLYPVNLALHCRFTKGSDSWLSPNFGRTTLWIEVATAKGTPDYEGFFAEMERRWFAIPGARPHWAKLYQERERIKARYPKMNDFLVARETWDPERVFLNEFLEKKIFQLPALMMAPSPMPPAPPAPGPPTPP